MVTEYKLIPYNTYRECLAITFKNVLTNNRWSIERALELYHESNQSYKDYLRCKYTLLLLGPRAENTVSKVIDKPISKNNTSEKSSYYKEAKQRFVSLLTNFDTEIDYQKADKKNEHLPEDKNDNNTIKRVDKKLEKNTSAEKKKPNMSFSIKKQLQAYVGQTVSDSEVKQDSKDDIIEEKQEINQVFEDETTQEMSQEPKQNQNREERPKEDNKYEIKQDSKEDIKVSNKNGTAVIYESGNSTIYLDT